MFPVSNHRSQVQFESTFPNKVGQPLLTLTFFSETRLASSGCFSVSAEPLREATGLLFFGSFSLSEHLCLQPPPCPQNLSFEAQISAVPGSRRVFLPLSSSQASLGYFGPRVCCRSSLSLVRLPTVKRERPARRGWCHHFRTGMPPGVQSSTWHSMSIFVL